ncbi:MAG: V-type ATP synthase subunit E [Clostridium sp.]|uniref:V-type ATP synthase subunit E n=1 Tax=Clostridium sp. DSM 8431 TaxID=1761781 RepID=UPI0008E8BAA6|nr:V-type ATP synthase subunit E [Clostridium sp. DSM 8431]MCR4944831.1 V-type ATP synthase subunit E [Clostridium sp.]SFU43401.1 V/A-type H+-transporting ATPase subunit E [Clostridium sp. DSM 8431]
MSNVNNLTSKILQDAEERKAKILADAANEKASIIEKKTKEADSLEAQMLEKAKREAETAKERVISGAELKARNEKLKAKQVIIKEVFEKSIEELCKLDGERYIAFVKETILSSGVAGDEKLVLNEEGKKFITEAVVNEINSGLVSKGKKGAITLSSETGNFKGGFILEKDGIEINNTFEALVNSLKEDLEFEVARELFN